MNMAEIRGVMGGPRQEAVGRLFALFREGITNSVAIPDIETEADQAAHHLLGCDNYTALLIVYAAADDFVDDDDVPPAVIDIVKTMADRYLRQLADQVVAMRGPIGPNNCDRTRNVD